MRSKPVYAEAEQALQTRAEAIHYDFATRIGKVDLAAFNCVDMSGAINLFKQLDSDVRKIVAGDTCYEINDDGKWWAYRIPAQRKSPKQ